MTTLVFIDVPLRSLMSTRFMLHASLGLIAGTALGLWSYQRDHLHSRLLRLVMASVDAVLAAVCAFGASLLFSFLLEGISTLPLALAFGAGLQAYALILGFLLFSMLWSVRVLLQTLWHLRAGREIEQNARSLVHAPLAALLAAAVAVGIQWRAIGTIGPLDGLQLFYATTMPALVAFGWFATDSRKSSKLFVLACVWAAVNVGLAAFPLTFHDGRYGVSCPGGGEAYHRVFGFRGYPWEWRNSATEQLLFGPAAVMELTFWYLVDPQPKC